MLPTFSNIFEDNFTPTQWLYKVINHKTGATWTNAKTITHVKNAFRGDLIDWFDSLSALGIDTTNWDNVKTAFENNFRVKTSAASIVQQIPEIKQLQEETMVQYFSNALRIMAVLSSKKTNGIGHSRLHTSTQLGQIICGITSGNKNSTKHANEESHDITGIKHVFTLIITAGLKPDIRIEVLKQENMTLPQIKELAIKHENLLWEKQKQPIKLPKTNKELEMPDNKI